MLSDLFGHPELNKPKRASNGIRRLHRLHAIYGHGPEGQTCKGCAYLKRSSTGCKTFFKCALAGDTRSEATDWRMKWPACGKYTERR